MTPGQRGDAPIAVPILAPSPPVYPCAADAACGSKALCDFLIERGTDPSFHTIQTEGGCSLSTEACRRRNIVERAFCHLNDWRRVATRYDKPILNFAATRDIAAIVVSRA